MPPEAAKVAGTLSRQALDLQLRELDRDLLAWQCTNEIPGSNQLRVPDNLTTTTLTEVKNVASQSYTRQLRDFAAYSQSKGLTFELYVRPSTRLSRSLNDAIVRGEIVRKYIPGAK